MIFGALKKNIVQNLPTINLYVFAGQSNMEDRSMQSELSAPYQYIKTGMSNVRLMYVTSFGNSNFQFITPNYSTDSQKFGPDASFLWNLSNDNPSDIIYAVKVAYDASRLWYRTDRKTWDVSIVGELYNTLFYSPTENYYIKRASDAIKAANPGYNVKVEAVIWKQGEGDIMDMSYSDPPKNYYANFSALSNAVRSVHGNSIKWILSKHSYSTFYEQTWFDHWQNELTQILNANPLNKKADEPQMYRVDGIHLTADGAVIMGENYYNAYKSY